MGSGNIRMLLKTRQFSNLLCSFCETLRLICDTFFLWIFGWQKPWKRSSCCRTSRLWSSRHPNSLFSFPCDGSNKNVCLNCVSEEEEDVDLPPGRSEKGAGLHTHHISVFPHTHQWKFLIVSCTVSNTGCGHRHQSPPLLLSRPLWLVLPGSGFPADSSWHWMHL